MHRDLEYEKNNIGYDYQYPEGGIKCKNYELCNAVLPDWWYECKGHYICTNCDILFGTWGNGENAHYGKGELIFSNNLECPICLQNERCVSQPRCEHFACLNCFKRCYFLDQSNDGAPEFPYDSEIEEEYNENPDDTKWDINYPLIGEYNEMWNAWDDAKREKYDNEKYLRVCPLCRK
jgi:hypothetical protein